MAITKNLTLTVGNIATEPAMRQTDAGVKSVFFRIAVNDSYKSSRSGEWRERSDFLPVKAYGKAADYILKYCKVGELVLVEGKMRCDSWDENGTRRESTYIRVENVSNLSFRGTTKETDGSANNGEAPYDEIDRNSIPF